MVRALHFQSDIGPTPKLDWAKISELRIDRNYQRDAIPKHIQRIASGFDWRFFQPPTICPAKEGGFWVIDGQQRTMAAKLRGDIPKLPCYIIDAPMTEEQARAFVRVNKDRRNVNTVNIYWAGLAARDPQYLSIERILKSVGIEVSSQLGRTVAGKTNSISSISRALDRYGEDTVTKALRTLQWAYPKKSGVLSGVLILALAAVYAERPRLNEKSLTALMANLDSDQLRFDAAQKRKFEGGSTPAILKTEILRRYDEAKKR